MLRERYGILFENIDGSETNQTLDMSDSRDLVINVEQAAGKGLSPMRQPT